jgi:hypothetical protein
MRRLLTGKAMPAIVTGIVTMSIAGGGYALAAGAGGTSIKACVTRGSHVLYKGPCASHDKKITLSKTGLTGPAGATGLTGPAGAPGAPGAPGATGVVTFGSWAGGTSSIPVSSGFVFAGPTATLTTTATQSIIASSESALGTAAGTASANIAICKSPATGTPTPTELDPAPGGAFSNVTVTTTRATYAADETGTPGAGTWTIGECVDNTSAVQAIDANDWTLGYAFVVNGTPAPGSSAVKPAAGAASHTG